MSRIVITGDRADGRLVVVRDHESIRLTVNQYALLATLAHQRLTSTTGFASGDPLGQDLINPVSILRLRRAIGAELIETGVSCEYRLRPQPSEIIVSESFVELPDGIIPPDLKSQLVEFVCVSGADSSHRTCTTLHQSP